jgi:hypothetical protein
VSLYLDASVLVTLFVIDPSSARAEAFLSAHPEIVVVSDFGVRRVLVCRRAACADATSHGKTGSLHSPISIHGSHDPHTGRRSRPAISTQQIGFCGVLISTFVLRMRSISRSLGDWTQHSSLSTEAWPPAPVLSA